MEDKIISYPKVAIIILNWNGWKDTIECLESVQKLSYPNYQIVLVDNASTDDSLKNIKKWSEGKIPVNTKFVKFSPELKPVKFIEYDRATALNGGISEKEKALENIFSEKRMILILNKENLGFAGGNNVSMRYSLKRDYDYVWLLNNDSVVDKHALSGMVELIKVDEKIGMVGSTIFDYYNSTKIQSIGVYSPLPRLEKLYFIKNNKVNEDMNYYKGANWLWAASLLVISTCLRNIGLLDENYFYCFEDVDWSYRERENDWKLLCSKQSKIWHKGGSKVSKINRKFLGINFVRNAYEYFHLRGYYELRNELYFTLKHSPRYFLLSLLFDKALTINIILLDNKKIKRTKVVFKVIKDALTNNMGRRSDGKI